MHDAITAESLGLPAVSVITTQFVSAADLMATVLGIPGYQFSVIDHPVSSASSAELLVSASHTMLELERLVVNT